MLPTCSRIPIAPNPMPYDLRLDSHVTEEAIATAAKKVLEEKGVTHKEAATALELGHHQAVTMSLNLKKYPKRGHAVRRAILRHYAGIAFSTPRYKVVRPGDEDDAGDDS